MGFDISNSGFGIPDSHSRFGSKIQDLAFRSRNYWLRIKDRRPGIKDEELKFKDKGSMIRY